MKIFYESRDNNKAIRFQGWTEFQPLYLSPYFGHLVENLALIEISRFFQNNGKKSELFFLRSKEKVKIDFLIKLSNNRWVAAEVKTTPTDFTEKQLDLLQSVRLNVIEKWTLSLVNEKLEMKNCRILPFTQIYQELMRLM